MIRLIPLLLAILLSPASHLQGASLPLTFQDASEKKITIRKPPKRVVSLVPSVTEVLMAIGAGDPLVGLTHHSVLPGLTGKTVVGGFMAPNVARIKALRPEVIFYSDLQQEVVAAFKGKATLIQLAPATLTDSFQQITLLGQIFNREQEAAAIIAEQQRQLALIARKVKKIPADERQRVMRLMGRDKVMAPGDDSFQNEYIKAAGAEAPRFGQNGAVIQVSQAQGQAFNPQVIYGCGAPVREAPALHKPGWRQVAAVRDRRLYNFPCDLTCRLASHPGDFVSWLAARLYNQQFSDPASFVLPQQVVERRKLKINLDYVSKAEVVSSDIKDFRNKSVLLHLKEPMTVVSTLGGQRQGIRVVANHYFPPPAWGLGHEQGVDALRHATLAALDLEPATSAILFTGANMANLAVVKKSYRDMEVYALVTAGVRSNAVRMAADSGNFYELAQTGKNKKPGTINILLLTNMELSPRAMTRALISATEGKSAALQDMDIRSSYSPLTNPATGTGTDNIIVVEGRGPAISNSGGHSKMGELMARAVYAGVQEAVHRQNGLSANRSIFQRLRERKVDLPAICRSYCGKEARAIYPQLERLLLEPRYSGFLQSILAISDDYERGLVSDLSGVELWCRKVAHNIGGAALPIKPVAGLPLVLGKGLGAILSGLSQAQTGSGR